MPSGYRSPRLIAIDMDGTLLGTDGRVSARTLAALRHAERHAAEVVIATGRRHCYAMKVLRDVALPGDNALISSNGAVTRRVDSELLARTLLPASTALWLTDHLAPYRDTMVLTFDLVGDDGEDRRGALVVEHVHQLHHNVGQWMQANEPYIAQVDRIEDALASDSLIQMMLCGPVKQMRAAEALLLEHEGVFAEGLHVQERLHTAEVALHRTEYAERDLCILDILPAGCSKGAALLALAASRGIGADEVMAIGDNWNDVSMLEVAGRAVVMGNASAEIKQLAAERGWAIAGSNAEDGVAAALEEAFAALPALATAEGPMVVS